MQKKIQFFVAIALGLTACNSQPAVEHHITVSGKIDGANGKYIKIIDMTQLGFKPDSILIDANGQFGFSQKSDEPKDFVLYIEPESNIRILPCPDDSVRISAIYPDIAATCNIHGSAESERLLTLLKKHNHCNFILDTLNHYYMANQLNRDLNKVIEFVRQKSDSILKADRLMHEQFIREQPNSLASYVALSSKLGLRTNLFDIQRDMPFFEMVDTALMNRYDTIAITTMLNRYVKQAKAAKTLQPKSNGSIAIGDTMPDLAMANPYGDTIRLSKLAGKYVLVNFWGSWCRPAREQHPELRKVFRKYRYRGFDIYSIALERNLDDWKNTIREDRLIWINHVSELNYMDSRAARQLGVESVPFNALIDGNRVVIAKNLTTEQLNEKLAELIK